MGRFVAVALGAAVLVLSGCGDSGDDAAKEISPKPPEVNKYAHMLDALAEIEGGEADDDGIFNPNLRPKELATNQNKHLGWSARSEFRFVEIYPEADRSCIVSDEAYLVQPGPVSDGPLEYYLGDGDACSYERADAKVVYRFVTITDDGRLKYRAAKGADVAPRTVKTAPMF